MKAKQGSNEAKEDVSSSSEEFLAAKEEPVEEEEEVPQFIEAWDELDEEDTLDGDRAIRQNGGTESVAVGVGGSSGTAEERSGMGLTDDVLTQLLGFQLDDLEEEDLVREHVALGRCQWYMPLCPGWH